MDLEIRDKKPLLYITQGDILVDYFLPFESYLVSFDSFDNDNQSLYKLIPLNGSGSSSVDGKSANDIKELIMENKLTHYSKNEYSLYLVKKKEVVK